jgi:hypothetical protein
VQDREEDGVFELAEVGGCALHVYNAGIIVYIAGIVKNGRC